MAKKSFYEAREIENLKKIKELSAEMPLWFSDFLRSNENIMTSLTRLNYCYDIKTFLTYLNTKHSLFKDHTDIKEIPAKKMALLTLKDLEVYIEYIGLYVNPNTKTEIENKECGKSRKIASLRTLFKYLYKIGYIPANPTELINMPKIHEKPIVKLEPNEITELIRIVETGEGLTKKQKVTHNINVKRDVAIIVLFLSTGIRISELVGLNIDDIDFENLSFKITRKGGNQTILFFNSDTGKVLKDYIEQRKTKGTYSPSSPLFLSLRNNRMSVRSIEYLVKKYTKLATPLKKITPHKLRSTYGTELYKECGDIYLVADVLGHKDVNTTRKHYAAMSEENRRKAAQLVTFRENR